MTGHEIEITATYRGFKLPEDLDEAWGGQSDDFAEGFKYAVDLIMDGVPNIHVYLPDRVRAEGPNTRVFRFNPDILDSPNRWYVQGTKVLFLRKDLEEQGLVNAGAALSDLEGDVDWIELDSVYLTKDQFRFGGRP